jgi:flagellar motor switch protein FliN/FliY
MADNTPVFHTLIQVWAGHFVEAWESMTGSRPEMSVPEPAKASADQSAPTVPPLTWYRFTYGKDPEIGTFFGSNTWEKIGATVLQAAGVADPSPDDIRGTCLEILNQAASALARTLTKQAGREILAASRAESPAPPEDLPRTSLRFRIEDSEQELLLVGAENLPALLVSPAPREKPSSPPPKPDLQSLGNSMDLLLDVELPVSVSFGHAQLPLKDVLKLTTGSIVELNRSVSEPVEVIVNNCVIARGEVVVVEGNFGVRIRHVVSRQERLQSLK